MEAGVRHVATSSQTAGVSGVSCSSSQRSSELMRLYNAAGATAADRPDGYQRGMKRAGRPADLTTNKPGPHPGTTVAGLALRGCLVVLMQYAQAGRRGLSVGLCPCPASA